MGCEKGLAPSRFAASVCPPGHLAHFVRDTVREALDLSTITGVYKSEQGQPHYHPGMLVALLLYGYSRGIYSSRQLARACEKRVDMMAVTGLNKPVFRTINTFRRWHVIALRGLFVQIPRLCQTAELVKLGNSAVDGTRLRANASRHTAMTYTRMAGHNLYQKQKGREIPPLPIPPMQRPSALRQLLDLGFAKHDVLARHRIIFLLFHLAGHVPGILFGYIEIPRLRAAYEANEDGVRFGHGQQLQPAGRWAGGFLAPFLSMPTCSSSGKACQP
jgi:transposase